MRSRSAVNAAPSKQSQLGQGRVIQVVWVGGARQVVHGARTFAEMMFRQQSAWWHVRAVPNGERGACIYIKKTVVPQQRGLTKGNSSSTTSASRKNHRGARQASVRVLVRAGCPSKYLHENVVQ